MFLPNSNQCIQHCVVLVDSCGLYIKCFIHTYVMNIRMVTRIHIWCWPMWCMQWGLCDRYSRYQKREPLSLKVLGQSDLWSVCPVDCRLINLKFISIQIYSLPSRTHVHLVYHDTVSLVRYFQWKLLKVQNISVVINQNIFVRHFSQSTNLGPFLGRYFHCFIWCHDAWVH